MLLTIEEAKQRLPLNELSRRLAIPGEIPDRDGKTVPCFWPDRHANGDRNPSFNFHSGLTRFKCFSCGLSGDGPDLVSLALGIDRKEAIGCFIEMAGGVQAIRQGNPKERKAIRWPSDLSMGTEADWRSVAKLRQVCPYAVGLAAAAGVLRFGTVKGFPAWIVTDKAKKAGEARRIDGGLFPTKDGAGRKVHTLAGSDKSWPIGIRPAISKAGNIRDILLVEGSADILAAYHFMERSSKWCAMLPVSMLGRNCRRIHPDALRLFRGKAVRVYPHADKDGGGVTAAERWSHAILEAGAASVTWFDFRGLTRKDGKPVSDLNDCTVISDESKPNLEGLMP